MFSNISLIASGDPVLAGILLCVLFGLGKVAYDRLKRYLDSRRLYREAEQQQATRIATDREQARQRHDRYNALARNMQLAILQLPKATDFQRAASFANAARAVPTVFRQQQYRRLRPLLVRHYVRCLENGVDPELLSESLRSLVVGLGVAEFEAEYIRQEAEQSRTADGPRGAANYSQQIQHAHRDHQQRLAALRALELDDNQLREQLIEAEQMRFRGQLLEDSDLSS